MTSVRRTLPRPSAIASLLSDLLGKQVQVKPATGAGPSTRDPGVAGLYMLDDGIAGAVIVCDLATAAAFGAALALIPPGVAADAVKRRKLDDNLLDNCKEVFNIMGGLVNQSGLPHVRLGSLPFTPPAPQELTSFLAQQVERAAFTIDVAGYGGGALAVVIPKASE